MKTTTTIILSALAIAIATAADTVRRPFKLDLKQPGRISTLVGFVHDGPPPWQDGNCTSIGKWAVLNIFRFRVVKLDQVLDLVPDGWMTWTTESKSWLALQREPVKSQVSYRPSTEPQKPK